MENEQGTDATASTKVNVTPSKEGFNWMALLFGGVYYAGYGNVKKGIMLIVPSTIPLFAIFINIYCGKKANSELPIGQQEFNWKNALLVFLIPVNLGSIIIGIREGGGSEQQMLSDVSGVWRGDSDAAMVAIDFADKSKSITIGGNKAEVKITNIDTENGIISFTVMYNQQPVTWTLKQNWDQAGKTFTLAMTLHEGTQDTLSFVRNL